GIEGGGILLYALCAHFAVARFVSDAAAERCWTNHRSDGLGTEGQRHHEIRDRGGRTAGGTTGRMLGVVWIRRVSQWRSTGKLGRPLLAQKTPPRPAGPAPPRRRPPGDDCLYRWAIRTPWASPPYP